jgi:hypothetical protein
MDGFLFLVLLALALVAIGFCGGVVFAIYRYSEWEDDTGYLMRQVDSIMERASERIKRSPDDPDTRPDPRPPTAADGR